MKTRLDEHFSHILGFAISSAGAITANMELLEYWLKIVAATVGIITGLLTIWSLLSGRRGVDKIDGLD